MSPFVVESYFHAMRSLRSFAAKRLLARHSSFVNLKSRGFKRVIFALVDESVRTFPVLPATMNPESDNPRLTKSAGFAWMFIWSVLFIGAVLCVWALVSPRANVTILAGFVCLVFATFVSVVVHELAHFVVGWALGLRMWCISVGDGDILLQRPIRKVLVVVRASPFSGAVYPMLSEQESSGDRRYLWMIAAAPFTNFVLALFPAMLFATGAVKWNGFDALDAASLLVYLMLSNLWLCVISLAPWADVNTDGVRILKYLFPRWKWIHRSRPAVNSPPAPSWNILAETLDGEFVLKLQRDQLKNPALPPEKRCEVLDGFATATLVYGASQCFSEALEYTTELMAAKPDDLSIKGSHGSMLIENGKVDEGILLLKDLFDSKSSAFNRGFAAVYLGFAAVKLGNITEAEQWAQQAQKIDSQSPCLGRLKEAIATGQHVAPSRETVAH